MFTGKKCIKNDKTDEKKSNDHVVCQFLCGRQHDDGASLYFVIYRKFWRLLSNLCTALVRVDICDYICDCISFFTCVGKNRGPFWAQENIDTVRNRDGHIHIPDGVRDKRLAAVFSQTVYGDFYRLHRNVPGVYIHTDSEGNCRQGDGDTADRKHYRFIDGPSSRRSPS